MGAARRLNFSVNNLQSVITDLNTSTRNQVVGVSWKPVFNWEKLEDSFFILPRSHVGVPILFFPLDHLSGSEETGSVLYS
jgi:hypothetical protein